VVRVRGVAHPQEKTQDERLAGGHDRTPGSEVRQMAAEREGMTASPLVARHAGGVLPAFSSLPRRN
jgi:hypothetical protein